jgi:predicted secreted Zn-dependent protease
MIKRYAISFIALFCLVNSLSSDASAAPEISVTTKYYSVYGETGEEINESLKANGPIGESGERVTALTKSNMQWRITMQMGYSLCHLVSATINVDITYILPKLEGIEYLEPELALRWKKFIIAVERHEYGHRMITESSASKMEMSLGNMGSEESCDILKARANVIGDRIHGESIELNNKYDLDTGHGKTQGVVF